MACISKLANAIAYNCDSGAAGLASAIIINKSDIASFVLSSPQRYARRVYCYGNGWKGVQDRCR